MYLDSITFMKDCLHLRLREDIWDKRRPEFRSFGNICIIAHMLKEESETTTDSDSDIPAVFCFTGVASAPSCYQLLAEVDFRLLSLYGQFIKKMQLMFMTIHLMPQRALVCEELLD